MSLCTLGLNPLLLKTRIHWVLGFTSWPKMCEILDISMSPLNMWVVLQPHMQIFSSLFCGGFWIAIPYFLFLPFFSLLFSLSLLGKPTHPFTSIYLSIILVSPFSLLFNVFLFPKRKKEKKLFSFTFLVLFFFFLRKIILRVKDIGIQWFFFPTRREGVMIL